MQRTILSVITEDMLIGYSSMTSPLRGSEGAELGVVVVSSSEVGGGASPPLRRRT